MEFQVPPPDGGAVQAASLGSARAVSAKDAALGLPGRAARGALAQALGAVS